MRECNSPALPVAVTNVIRHLAFRAGYLFLRFGHSRRDLEQELTLHYLRRCHQHDSKRASAATFASNICRHRLFNLFEAETACRRSATGGLASLSEPVAIGPSGRTIERGATISEDSYNMNAGRRSRPDAELIPLRIDVDQVVSGLPAELADVAHLLAAGESPEDVARQLEISRATVHRRVVRLRRIFRGAGLGRYLDMQEAA